MFGNLRGLRAEWRGVLVRWIAAKSI